MTLFSSIVKVELAHVRIQLDISSLFSQPYFRKIMRINCCDIEVHSLPVSVVVKCRLRAFSPVDKHFRFYRAIDSGAVLYKDVHVVAYSKTAISST